MNYKHFCVHRSSFIVRLRMASLLLTLHSRGMWSAMTRTRWMIFGAMALGVAIVVYVVLFCPAECH